MRLEHAKLSEHLQNAVLAINDAAWKLQKKGFSVLLPETIDVSVELIHTVNGLQRSSRNVGIGVNSTDTAKYGPETQTETTTAPAQKTISTESGADISDVTNTFQ